MDFHSELRPHPLQQSLGPFQNFLFKSLDIDHENIEVSIDGAEVVNRGALNR